MATKIIVGLGNPGAEYEQTRHNIGFLFVDYLAHLTKTDDFSFDKKLDAEITKTKLTIGGKQVTTILVKSASFVNQTGQVVAKLKKLYTAKPEDFIITQDDLDIPFGNFKLSFEKNSGGHRGVESIIAALKTTKFWRVRFGIANTTVKKAHQQVPKKKDEMIKDFVLSKLTKSNIENLQPLFASALERLEQQR